MKAFLSKQTIEPTSPTVLPRGAGDLFGSMRRVAREELDAGLTQQLLNAGVER
jgi:predicted RecA/RadA family phage recombinase